MLVIQTWGQPGGSINRRTVCTQNRVTQNTLEARNISAHTPAWCTTQGGSLGAHLDRGPTPNTLCRCRRRPEALDLDVVRLLAVKGCYLWHRCYAVPELFQHRVGVQQVGREACRPAQQLFKTVKALLGNNSCAQVELQQHKRQAALRASTGLRRCCCAHRRSTRCSAGPAGKRPAGLHVSAGHQ